MGNKLLPGLVTCELEVDELGVRCKAYVLWNANPAAPAATPHSLSLCHLRLNIEIYDQKAYN